jgi:hypothetical protein
MPKAGEHGGAVVQEGRVCSVQCGRPLPGTVRAVARSSSEGIRSARGSSRTGLVIVVLLVAVLLLISVGIGSCLYHGYRAAKTAFSAQPAPEKPRNPAESSHARPSFKVAPCSPLVSTPANREELASLGRATIPLVPGLILVDAWHSKIGDHEDIARVESVNEASVHITHSGISGSGQPLNASRDICQSDLQTAGTYITQFGGYAPDVIHGSTNFSLSRSLFKQLKNGKAYFLYQENIRMTGPDSYSGRSFPGTLERVESDPVMFPLIVNDQRVELPAIHARGELADAETEIWVLDDPINPVTLRYSMPSLNFGIEMIRISFPVSKPQLEQQLAEKGRAEVYGIYFDFASAEIRAESEPILQEIAGVLNRNPLWKLNVEGHTDNIGGDAYNMDLSRRRAEAVKQALVDRYHIAAERLSGTGFGASRPKETNDTMAGRARNRRVELVRQ